MTLYQSVRDALATHRLSVAGLRAEIRALRSLVEDLSMQRDFWRQHSDRIASAIKDGQQAELVERLGAELHKQEQVTTQLRRELARLKEAHGRR